MRDLSLHALLAMLATQNGVLNVHEAGARLPTPKPAPLPPMLTSQRNDPRRWDADHSGALDTPMTDADACRINEAQAKRDRKAAKRLRDAKGGRDA